MAVIDEWIDQLGGGGPVGLAVATVLLAPAFFPPLRRSLRGLAKGVIVQYLRVTSPGPPGTPEPEQSPAAARPRRRSRPAASPAPAASAEPASVPRPRRARPAPPAGEPGVDRAPQASAPASRNEAAAARRSAPPAGEPQPASHPSAAAARLNLNTATRGQLTGLPRIGTQTADRIIEFRQQQGPIRNLRQLRQADVISVAAARQIREMVRF